MIPMKDIQDGFAEWANKPHNKKWARLIDGTPIPNDVPVSIWNYIQGKQKTSTPAEIDRLKAENERLRSALSEISNAFTAYGYSDAMDAVQALRDIAKEALNADR